MLVLTLAIQPWTCLPQLIAHLSISLPKQEKIKKLQQNNTFRYPKAKFGTNL